MTEIADLTTARARDQLIAAAAARGIRVRVDSDFRGYLAASRSVGRQPGPPFDPVLWQQTDTTPSRAFWVVGHDARGSVVHLQAVRLDNLAETVSRRVESYWLKMHRHLGDTFQPKPRFSSAPIGEVSGRIAYHGDLWVADGMGAGGGRRIGMADILAPLALIESYRLWSPDSVYAIVDLRKARTGAAYRWGYSHVQSGGLRWETPPAGIPMNECIVRSDRADIEHLAREITEWGLQALAESQSPTEHPEASQAPGAAEETGGNGSTAAPARTRS